MRRSAGGLREWHPEVVRVLAERGGWSLVGCAFRFVSLLKEEVK